MRLDSPLIDADNLAGRLGDDGLRVLDCRFDLMQPDAGRNAWLSGHIPGAVFADLDRDLAGPVRPDSGRHPLPDAGEFAATLGRLGISNDTDVVVYDAGSGALAARAWWLLRWLGHEHVALLERGFAAWVVDGHGTESGESVVAPARFRGSPRKELVMTTADVVAASNLLLVDARDAARFRGELEPIDPVAGHVPGARNLPFSDTLNDDNGFKPSDELREIWKGVLGEPAGQDWAVMCGSGVTACHLAVSGLLAGYGEPRLYAGSWSEWIRDPQRPVGKGN